MNQSDCVIIDIEKGVECPLCCNNVSIDDMVHSCKRNINGHNVCKYCVADLKKSGFQKGCVYCGDRSEDNNIIVVPSNAVTTATRPINNHTNQLVIVQPNRGSHFLHLKCDSFCEVLCGAFLALALILIVYTIGVLLYHIGEIIDYWFKNKDHSDKEVDFSLRKCAIGYIIFAVCVYIIFQCILLIQVTTEKCLIPCYKKLRPSASRS